MYLTDKEQSELNTLIKNYKSIGPFIKKYKRLSFMQLEYSFVHDLTLFTIEPDFSFEVLENIIDTVLQALPSIKRIFAKPCIHLKQQSVILPTESVRIINNDTIQHVSSHSELWTDLTDDEIKPSKLLTQTYEDNYGIYENLVFCNVIDDILSFARSKQRFFEELIYTNKTIELNLLERINHLDYFLALGKLHTGYNRDFDAYYAVSMRCLNKLNIITDSIVPRLKRPVYKKNKIRPAQIKVRKTNILSMHRDYNRIYRLAKYLSLYNLSGSEKINDADINTLQNNYFHFCELLCLFAASHFNFACDKDTVLNFSKLNAEFTFKDWQLNIKSFTKSDNRLLSVTVKRDTEYKIILVPFALPDSDELLNTVRENEQADEIVLCTPFEDRKDDDVFISMTNIESFRRLQRLILKGMIFTDDKRKDCPFCNNELTVISDEADDKPVYKCFSCRTEIREGYCPTTEKTYPYTKIAGLIKPSLNIHSRFIKRETEAQMSFRNVTDINGEMQIICPYCRQVHKTY